MDYLKSANENIVVMVQIETKEGVENMEGIIGVEGIGKLNSCLSVSHGKAWICD